MLRAVKKTFNKSKRLTEMKHQNIFKKGFVFHATEKTELLCLQGSNIATQQKQIRVVL
jgi:hypothetical protein